jgi:hypothetical protein
MSAKALAVRHGRLQGRMNDLLAGHGDHAGRVGLDAGKKPITAIRAIDETRLLPHLLVSWGTRIARL